MEVSIQQAEGEARPAMPQHCPSEALKKGLAVDVISHDGFAAAALRDHVVNRAREVFSG
jgi:hypothetical protein